MRSDAYIDVDGFKRTLISAGFGCVYARSIVQTPENVAFWMRPNAASQQAPKRGERVLNRKIFTWAIPCTHLSNIGSI